MLWEDMNMTAFVLTLKTESAQYTKEDRLFAASTEQVKCFGVMIVRPKDF